jgi:hypothetical protein
MEKLSWAVSAASPLGLPFIVVLKKNIKNSVTNAVSGTGWPIPIFSNTK